MIVLWVVWFFYVCIIEKIKYDHFPLNIIHTITNDLTFNKNTQFSLRLKSNLFDARIGAALSSTCKYYISLQPILPRNYF